LYVHRYVKDLSEVGNMTWTGGGKSCSQEAALKEKYQPVSMFVSRHAIIDPYFLDVAGAAYSTERLEKHGALRYGYFRLCHWLSFVFLALLAGGISMRSPPFLCLPGLQAGLALLRTSLGRQESCVRRPVEDTFVM